MEVAADSSQPTSGPLEVGVDLARTELGEHGAVGVEECRRMPTLDPHYVAQVTALRRLPIEQRRALALYHLVDLPVADVVHEIGVPVGTVKP
jgi:RNA polymerase sigma-70 factor (ECF subfamily)